MLMFSSLSTSSTSQFQLFKLDKVPVIPSPDMKTAPASSSAVFGSKLTRIETALPEDVCSFSMVSMEFFGRDIIQSGTSLVNIPLIISTNQEVKKTVPCFFHFFFSLIPRFQLGTFIFGCVGIESSLQSFEELF
jgi:hypothetical protein